jgi:acyl dehydratase
MGTSTSDDSAPSERIIVRGLAGLEPLVGREIGISAWMPVGQPQIHHFAEVTGDDQWIHTDVDRATRESPFGGPIAHGYLLLSLGPALAWTIFMIEGVRLAVNYGLDYVRFVSPVPSGARVRLRVALAELRDVPNGKLAAYDYTFELEGSTKPTCVARTLALYR